MAAEKLTKKRLIQLLIAMLILISAFLYRTCHYQTPQAVRDSHTAQNEKQSSRSFIKEKPAIECGL
ncbi:hypothetical protein A1D23_03040 [Chelonobacter oris]|uniref:hypothetical protein n=1 Tax=Chelonobacter oris TaxID=505317 RepID=UPI00244D7398|nr:hypothetical protein [Chelonobacter oris]MDH3001584.1 hypothetical protein [Chelonobacter oris]